MIAAVGIAVLLLGFADSDFATLERLTRLRVLGKAFYENPTTQNEAVAQFKELHELNPASAVDRMNYGLALLRAGKQLEGMAELIAVQKQDPTIPHTWFNLAIEYKKLGETAKAIAQMERMVQLVPDLAIAHYNLGVLYKLADRNEAAMEKFHLAARLDSNLAATHFQLFNAYRLSGQRDEAQKELTVFQELKKQQEITGNTEDVDWSIYSEIYETIDPKLAAMGADTQAAVKFAAVPVPGKADPATARLQVVDMDGDGVPDVLVTSSAGVFVYFKGATPLQVYGPAIAAVPGDFDNDGLLDLCVLTDSGPVLLKNNRTSFTPVNAGLPKQRFTAAAWLDYDHDYDLDLLLFGPRNALWRNQGQAGFADRTSDFPFVSGQALEAVGFRLVPDSKSLDLVVSYADRPAVLYHDQLGGKYRAVTVDAIPAGARSLTVADVDSDSFLDVVYRTEKGISLARNTGKWTAISTGAPSGALVLADIENRGLADIFSGNLRHRNLGGAKWSEAAAEGLPAGVAAWAAADFDGDGRTDLFAVLSDGSLRRFTNQTASSGNWLRVRLSGVKNLKTAPGAEVELKAGVLYQKRPYTGAPLTFGLRGYKEVEAVRITWPNGLIQNEIRQAASKAYNYPEAQRLSGSCPMIWVWNGRGFEFVTDVLGVAPLGASSGDGQYFPVDHDEYIQIRGDQLQERAGTYEIRITEELSEVSYLDQIELIALDHPSNVEIFTNDKWKAPPFPEFRLFGATRRVYAKRVIDDDGKDVTALVVRRDRRYPEGFHRDLNGVAGLHKLDLDFAGAAADGRAVLILNGWVDWADGSTFLAQAQATKSGLFPPQLQVKDSKGQWVTVIDDMGMPAGKPKTIAVDLTGKWRSSSREVRILTNLCVYWDEIFLIENSAAPETRLTALAPLKADLHFRGFSQPIIDPQRRQPEAFVYENPSALSRWNPTPGMYTRFGDVTPLIRSIDDLLLVMGSGDEVQLLFPARNLPSLPAGWSRDFLLKVDGWAKDRDANTAFGQSVEPLPFHAMSRYPYPASEHFPDDALHNEYRKAYNTRPALQFLRPLSARTTPRAVTITEPRPSGSGTGMPHD